MFFVKLLNKLLAVPWPYKIFFQKTISTLQQIKQKQNSIMYDQDLPRYTILICMNYQRLTELKRNYAILARTISCFFIWNINPNTRLNYFQYKDSISVW